MNSDCIFLVKKIGVCARATCRKPLPKYRRRWCSDACGKWYGDNHIWSFAKMQVYLRDKNACVKCGSKEEIEVNHIEPRRGQGYHSGCHNHHDNLEILCHNCHVKVTNEQRKQKNFTFANT